MNDINNNNAQNFSLDREIAELKAELVENPDDLVLKITIASALERVNKLEEARELYLQVISEDTEGRLAASASKAIEAMPSITAPTVTATSVITTSEQAIPDSLQKQIKELEAEIAKDPEDLVAQITLGAVLERSGQQERAKQVYAKVVARDGDGVLGSKAHKALEAMGITLNPTIDRQKSVTPAINKSPEYLKNGSVRQTDWRNRLQDFYNLPIAKKQLYSLFGAEAIALGLVGTGAILLVGGLRSQLLQQSQSELAVSEISYDIKIDQMGLGFRGQSQNKAIIEHLTNKNLPTGRVKEILRNEIWIRQIEFVTLVDSNGRLVVGAGNIPEGEIFNPNKLVTKAIGSNEQIKSSQLITYDELAKESSRFAKLRAEEKGDNPQTKPNFLIRYTATPVTAVNGQIVGVLVSGDVAKNPIVARTNNSFQSGYSAVYLYEGDNKFSLATAERMNEGKDIDNVLLPNTEILEEAVEANGKPVTKWKYIGSSDYALSAKVIKDVAGKPVAVIVRGTSPDRLNALLLQILSLQTLFIIIGSLLTIGLARFVTEALAKPIARLRESTLKFAEGDRSIRAEVLATDEVGELANTFNAMADSIVVSERLKEDIAKERQVEAEFQRQEKERLQKGVIKLLTEIDGAKMGDLTVKAKVEEGDMGSIADAFNTTIRSLREIVSRVKITAIRVQNSAQTNENSVQKLSEEAKAQVDSITSTLSSVEEMDRSIQSVAQSARSAAQIARDALNATQTGDRLMAETVDSIDRVRSSVAETSKKMKRLAESSQEISQIIGIISNISEKTNLLAFNASLEASRAGENGQGFRIVADEVRRLAERVTESIRDVEQLVGGIQSETAEVLQTMETSTNQVVTGTKLVRQTQGTLQQVAEIGQKIDELLQSISASTVSQAEYSQKMTGTMQDAVNISKQTSAESQVVSESLQDLLAIATKLQESVSQFKVN
jgi:twitching motility protein PilJ